MSLTVDTPIPTERRPFIRVFLKNKGLPASRDARNRDLLAFAIKKGLAVQVEEMLTRPLDELAKETHP